MATPGRKVTIPATTRTRLAGVHVCRSIDELLNMESETTENVHFIQYKVKNLSFTLKNKVNHMNSICIVINL